MSTTTKVNYSIRNSNGIVNGYMSAEIYHAIRHDGDNKWAWLHWQIVGASNYYLQGTTTIITSSFSITKTSIRFVSMCSYEKSKQNSTTSTTEGYVSKK
jgi:hypothetical protein